MNWATPDERRVFGQSRRKQLRRQQNNELNIKARKTTPLSLLERVERGRVPALLKLKHQMMAQSPFLYFRGAAPVMAADLAMLPNTGIEASSAAMPTCATSAPSPHPTAVSSSTSTISMKPSAAPSSGT